MSKPKAPAASKSPAPAISSPAAKKGGAGKSAKSPSVASPTDEKQNGNGGDDFDPSVPFTSKFFGQKPAEEEKTADGADGPTSPSGGQGNLPEGLFSNIDALTAADSLPIFADKSVRALDAQVKAKDRILQKFIDESEENSERVGVMAEHLKNVRAERVHSQALLDAKDKDIATEGHLGQLAEREFGQSFLEIVEWKPVV
jgi:hypothetical protein